MKTCSSCKQDLPTENFSKNRSRKDGLCHACKSCQSAKYQRWAEKTPESKTRHAEWQRAKVTENRLKFLDVLASSDGCVDCGYKESVAALVFDHVSGEKVNGVAQLINRGVSWDKIEKEIAKCELRCWNCHAIITSSRGNWWTVSASI